MRVKDYLKATTAGGGGQASLLRFKELETLDTGFYRCEATNQLGETIKSTAVVKVNLGSGKWRSSGGGGGSVDEDDYVHLPSSFQDPFEELDNVFGGGGVGGGGGDGGLGSHIEFQGRSPDQELAAAAAFGNGGRQAGGQQPAGLPSLKPDEKAGRCEKYIGSACAKVFGGGETFVFLSTDQAYVEKKLAATFVVMATSPDMTGRCAEFAIPAICHSTFPLCDQRTRRPRKLCRDECEVLEQDICRTELAIAKSHPMIGLWDIFKKSYKIDMRCNY